MLHVDVHVASVVASVVAFSTAVLAGMAEGPAYWQRLPANHGNLLVGLAVGPSHILEGFHLHINTDHAVIDKPIR